MLTRERCCCGLLVFVGLLGLAAGADQTAAGGTSQVDSGTTKPASDLPIEINHRRVRYGPTTCPVVVLGDTAYDLVGGKTMAALERKPSDYELFTLSASGRLAASAGPDGDHTNLSVTIYSTVTGKKLAEIPGAGPEKRVDSLAFAGEKWLVVGSVPNWLNLHDASTGRLVRTIRGQKYGEHIAVSDDGNCLAVAEDDQVSVYDLRTGQRVAALKPPPLKPTTAPAAAKPAAGAPRPPFGAAIPKLPPSPAETDFFFRYGGVEILSFSPDGKEVAMLCTRTGAHLLCWDLKGKVTFDEDLDLDMFPYPKPLLQWVPDGSGWLLRGKYLLDRKSKRIVWVIANPSKFNELQPHFVSLDRIVGDSDGKLRTVQVPWAQIRQSLQKINDTSEAVVRPRKAVSLKVELEGLRGDAEQTRKSILDTLTKRLANDGISVADNQPSVFVVKFQERQGEAVKIVEKQSPFERGKDTGRTAREASGDLVIELHGNGGKVLWQASLEGFSSTEFKEEINDETVRKSMMLNLLSKIRRANLPYFVSLEPGVALLPICQQP